MPAALDVNREAVKTLCIAVGVNEAARRMNLRIATVQAWSARGKWFAQVSQPPTVKQPASSASKLPSAALKDTLAERSKNTRLNLAKAAETAAEQLIKLPKEQLLKPDIASSAKSWTGVAGQVHGWSGANAGSGAVNLNVLCNNAAIAWPVSTISTDGTDPE